jgi:hypothetical protein
MYISFDDGRRWQRFQLNLPLTPITDLAIKNNDLVVATQGRSFWVLDDLTPLHQLKQELASPPAHLFTPRPTYRMPGGSSETAPRTEGQNAPAGVVFHYYLKDQPGKDAVISLEISQPDGAVIRTFSNKADATVDPVPRGGRGQGGPSSDRLEPKQGMNRFAWDLRYAPAEGFSGIILWAGGLQGPRAVPGKYQARLKLNDQAFHADFEVLPDPRISTTPEDFAAQLRFLLAGRDKLTETHRAIKQIRDLREQLTGLTKRLKERKDAQDVVNPATAIDKQITAIEETLYQTKAKSPQDVLNFPIRLNNKLSSLCAGVSMGDNRPTEQALSLRDELVLQIDAELTKLRYIVTEDLPRFNELVARKGVPAIFSEFKEAAKPSR